VHAGQPVKLDAVALGVVGVQRVEALKIVRRELPA
jgi:hypothetical protein